MPKIKEIHLDGSHLEGGGQLLRLALSLSCLTGQPLHVTDIRGNRPKSRSSRGRGGGLKKSHTECVKFLAAACNAETEGMVEGSDELRFWPSSGKPMKETIVEETKTQVGSAVDVKTIEVVQKTPGSIYLILQALLPYLLFGPFGTSNTAADHEAKQQQLVRLRITGGTNVSNSPSHEYATKVLFPTLTERLGIPAIQTRLIRRGWSGGTSEMGEVVFDITPLTEPLPAFRITDRGSLRSIEVCALANPQSLGSQIAELVCSHFEGRPVGKQSGLDEPEAEGRVVTSTTSIMDSGKKNRVYVLAIAHFESLDGTAHRVARDCLYDGRERMKGGEAKLVETVSKRIIKELEQEIRDGGAVDEYMQDQLVVFQALAEGVSKVERSNSSLHTQTARWVAERMLKARGVEFEEGVCRGTRFEPAGHMGGQNRALQKDDEADSLPKSVVLEPAETR